MHPSVLTMTDQAWQCTPYSIDKARQCVSRFRRFADTENLVSCMATTFQLSGAIQSYYDFLFDAGHMDRSTAPPPGPSMPLHAPSHYLFAVLLTLMRVTIKWERYLTTTTLRHDLPQPLNPYCPSQEAVKFCPFTVGLHLRHWECKMDVLSGGEEQAPNFYQDQLSPMVARLHLLRQAELHLREHAYRFGVLSQEPLVRAVEVTIADLQAQTKRMGPNYDGWLKWPFMMPAYNSTLQIGGFIPKSQGQTQWEASKEVMTGQFRNDMLVSPTPSPTMEADTANAASVDNAAPKNTSTAPAAGIVTPWQALRMAVQSITPGGNRRDRGPDRGRPAQGPSPWAGPGGDQGRGVFRGSLRGGTFPQSGNVGKTQSDVYESDTTPRKRRKITQEKRGPPYWTIGEVGNHSYLTDRFALVDDRHGGFDVYDVTSRLTGTSIINGSWPLLTGVPDHPMLANAWEFDKYTEMTQHGPVLHPDAHGWALENESTKRRGKLMVSKDLEDVLEMDGKDGRAHWVFAGRYVFDLAGMSLPLSTSTYR